MMGTIAGFEVRSMIMGVVVVFGGAYALISLMVGWVMLREWWSRLGIRITLAGEPFTHETRARLAADRPAA